ncbi:MAG: N-acetylglucosamine-6-phosphate deacetylase [Mycoplasma sp.]|nr:N-acetylglucosamine-6-phosphate deacetylase [Mycoplasma sp.]
MQQIIKQRKARKMLINNVKIVNAFETINNADILIENGIITKITRKDGEGTKIVIPGFIDTHIHGFNGYRVMKDKESIEQMSLHLAKNGTTSFFPTVMTGKFKKIISSIQDAVNAKSLGAIIEGIHMEGPFISKVKKGAHDERYIIPPNKNQLEEMVIASKNKIRKMTYAPELSNSEFNEYAIKNNIVLSIGHSNANFEQATNDFKKYATSATHLWNAMSTIQNRNEGIVAATFLDDKTYAELIGDSFHVDKKTIEITFKNLGPNRIILVSDSLEAAGLPDGEYISGGMPVIKEGIKITIKGTETIAGSATCIYDQFLFLSKEGVSLEDLVKISSYNASKNLSLKKLGEIKEGNFANINILDKNLALLETIIKGNKFSK